MSDDNQIYVPPSFVELYLPHGQIKARLPKAEIAQRHELCEDLGPYVEADEPAGRRAAID